MSVICAPSSDEPRRTTCVVCQKEIAPGQAVACLYDAEGALTFACNGHFWGLKRLIAGLADFAASQRLRQLDAGMLSDHWGDI